MSKIDRERQQLDYRAKLAKKYASADLEKIEADLHRQEYREMKKREGEDPDNIIRNSSQKISQKFAKIKDKEVVPQIKKDMAQLKDVIVAYIKNELDFQPLKKFTYYDKSVSYAEIEEIIQILLPVLKKYKTISANRDVITRQTNSYSLYERIFNDLIDIDARFATFAPIGSMNKPGVMEKVETLPDFVKDEIIARKEMLDNGLGQDYVDENEILEFDPQEKRVQDSNKILEKINLITEQACKKIGISIIEMSDEIYNLMQSELELNPNESPKRTNSEVKRILDLCSVTLRNVERLSNNLHVSKVMGWEKTTPFNTMFYNLVRIEPRFAFHAPTEVLSRLDLNFESLLEEEKDSLYLILKNEGLFEDDDYFKQYKRMFENQIADLGKQI